MVTLYGSLTGHQVAAGGVPDCRYGGDGTPHGERGCWSHEETQRWCYNYKGPTETKGIRNICVQSTFYNINHNAE